MNFLIRFANYNDLDSIVALYAETIKYICHITPNKFGKKLKKPLNLSAEKQSFTKALDDKETVIFVAEQRKKILGFVMGVIENHPDDFLEAPYLTIQYITIREKFRCTGVGKALMEKTEEWAAQKGFSTLELTVSQNNEPAQTLFHRLGYSPLEIRMVKKLTECA
ncbi:GNAT family N-acetyltransferase [candidate division WOR-3 bacterium]|nr:GNAT family N-acetyltransferase [candidate division WOR-3 bacterium]